MATIYKTRLKYIYFFGETKKYELNHICSAVSVGLGVPHLIGPSSFMSMSSQATQNQLWSNAKLTRSV